MTPINTRSHEFAPGIPAYREIKKFPLVDLKTPEKWDLALQYHEADKAGPHFDLRLVDVRGDAHSFVLRRGLPAPGEKVLAIQQPTHTKEYSALTGKFKIPEGSYGAGMVSSRGLIPIEVLRSTGDQLRFNIYGGSKSGNQEFSLIKTKDGHLLHNVTLTVEKGIKGHVIPHSKPQYKSLPIDSIDFQNNDQIMQAKVDGAHVSMHLIDNKPVKIFSYRPTERASGIIEHTHKLPNYQMISTPKGLGGTVLRGELYAVDKTTSKALPAEQVGGLLNASVWKSRNRQKESNSELRPIIFDVVQYRGKNVESEPYSEKLKILHEVSQKIPRLRLPVSASTPENKKVLLRRIREGKELSTKEGVVIWDKNHPLPAKAKLSIDVDAEIVGITGGKGKHEKRIGAILVRPEGTTAVTRVGSGLSDKLREEIAQDPESFKGRVIKLKAHDRFPSGKLRAPSFKEFHLDKGKQPFEV